ncbi:D-RIBOSE-BINDING PERIPLASMIC PROTEIN [Salix purpurea]|uniref:D-RIBOSE-BINDING PERIPLASMIC PROTEIN n=1 Tax=Salix purpurea TaxID=77065 RepID=A0A9Q0Z9G0_SALPP|nr:D-RIBOSE-BINDING PERIPLASMIC PROTEIN [Salix purpurea]
MPGDGSCIERDLCLAHLTSPPPYPPSSSSSSFIHTQPEGQRENTEMGNCQAIDAAALVIQHPSGKIERFYWPVSVSEVMRTNPGHYVSLIIPLPVSGDQENQDQIKTVQFTRVKLLRPSDNLTLGHAYRLVTTQEVMKVIRAKKNAKLKKQQQPESVDENKSRLQASPEKKRSTDSEAEKKPNTEKDCKEPKHERHRHRTPSISSASLRSKSWRPSLQSISEAAS